MSFLLILSYYLRGKAILIVPPRARIVPEIRVASSIEIYPFARAYTDITLSREKRLLL